MPAGPNVVGVQVPVGQWIEIADTRPELLRREQVSNHLETAGRIPAVVVLSRDALVSQAYAVKCIGAHGLPVFILDENLPESVLTGADKRPIIDYPGPGILKEKRLERHCLLYTSPSPRDRTRSRMPSSA